MSIIKAVDRAYRTMKERNWDTVYWAIDLHGVCLESNYEQGGYRWINQSALRVLRQISKYEETAIILWSSVHVEEQRDIIEFFNEHGITVDGFNANPFEANTKVSSFDQKFYFSILLDDKAGFDPSVDWTEIGIYLNQMKGGREMTEFSKQVERSDVGSTKPVVQFTPSKFDYIAVGHRADIYALDHPRLGEGIVNTSSVQKINEDGSFETHYSIYKPLVQVNG